EHGRDVLVELEVRRDSPAFFDLGGAVARERLRSAHADEDLLREAVPDRLVVQKLGMALEVLDRRFARLVVAARVQRDPVPPGDARVTLRGQLRPGTTKREVDVEENRPQGHSTSSSSHLTVSRWVSL